MEHLIRQAEIIPEEVLNTTINIIGAGAVGSFTALSLAKMGFVNQTVFDYDKVETVNLNSQFFRCVDVGGYKTEKLREIIYEFTGEEINIVNDHYTSGILSGIIISAVDNMSTRRLIWDNHTDGAIATKAIIDPRMGAEHALMYVMNPNDKKDLISYEKTLYSDEKAVHERCTAKATMYTVLSLAGVVCKAVKDLATGGNYVRTLTWNIADNHVEMFRKD